MTNLNLRQSYKLPQHLLLPDSFGDIYVGEVFSAYIAVVNGVEHTTFSNVSIAVRLQTANMAFDLLDTLPEHVNSDGTPALAVKKLEPTDTMDMIVKHPLSELGTHTMRVSISYFDTRVNETKSVRKFYRFNVLSALRVESKCLGIDGNYMVQCKVSNVTKNSLFVTDLTLDGADHDKFDIKKLSSEKNVNSGKNDSRKGNDNSNNSCELDENDDIDITQPFLTPNDTYAEAFILIPKERSKGASGVQGTSSSSSSSSSGGVDSDESKIVSIGAIMARWSSSMGESGYVRGNNIVPIVEDPKADMTLRKKQLDIVVKCISCPGTVTIAKTFCVTLSIANKETLPVNLQLQSRAALEDPSGLLLTGLSFRNLGLLESNKCIEVTLDVVSLGTGIHELRSVVLLDLMSARELHLENLVKVFVE